MRTAVGRRAWDRVRRLGAWGVLDQAALAFSGFLVTISVARTGGADDLGLFVLPNECSVLFVGGIFKAVGGEPMGILAKEASAANNLFPVGAFFWFHGLLGLILAVVVMPVAGSHQRESC